MPNGLLRSPATLLLAALATFIPATASPAQAATPAANPDVVKLFHPPPPLPSYEVATIRQADPHAPAAIATAAAVGSRPRPGQQIGDGSETLQHYILSAYGASTGSQAQLAGAPAWVATDKYVIHGQASDQLREAMQKMTPAQRQDQERALQQSILADRFHLKAHFEIRQLPIFELTPARSGLKIKPVAVSTPPDPASRPAPGSRPYLPPGMIVSMPGPDGGRLISMQATTMSTFANFLRSSPEINGRPILDRTGFTGYFDVTDLPWSRSSTDSDAPSLSTSLNENLGLKLTAAKGPVEVLVIDSIDRPTQN